MSESRGSTAADEVLALEADFGGVGACPKSLKMSAVNHSIGDPVQLDGVRLVSTVCRGVGGHGVLAGDLKRIGLRGSVLISLTTFCS